VPNNNIYEIMYEKFYSVDCESFSSKDLQEFTVRIPLLVLALIALNVAVVGIAATGVFQMGYDRGRG
jgi:hypothetical protein